MYNTSLNLSPKADQQKCLENAEALHQFGDNLSTNNINNNKLYDHFAPQYDSFIQMTGCNDAHQIAKYILQTQPHKHTSIVDMGCGTGIVGQLLYSLGYKQIIGIDQSKQMLEVCRNKRVYKQVKQLQVGRDVLGEQRSAGIVVSAACCIQGHFPSSCFQHMADLLVQGGLLIFTIRDIYLHPDTDHQMNYVQALALLQQNNVIKLVQQIPFIKYQNLQFGTGFKEDSAQLFVFAKC